MPNSTTLVPRLQPGNAHVPEAPASFETALLHFINEVLPTLSKKPTPTLEPVGPDTPLFETGRLDSLSILPLIATIENLSGQPVPDHLVVMRHFQSVRTITKTFCKS